MTPRDAGPVAGEGARLAPPEREPVLVQRWSETDPYDIARPQIAVDLMTYLVGPYDPAAGPLWLCWARLPG